MALANPWRLVTTLVSLSVSPSQRHMASQSGKVFPGHFTDRGALEKATALAWDNPDHGRHSGAPGHGEVATGVVATQGRQQDGERRPRFTDGAVRIFWIYNDMIHAAVVTAQRPTSHRKDFTKC